VARGWRALRAAEFLNQVRFLPFVLQAGQAAKSLTGYGLVLGGGMGFVTDTLWGSVRLAAGGSLRFEGPPPSDLLGKAARYIIQPAYHLIHGQMFTFEEHMMLAAADAVAVRVLSEAYQPGVLLGRMPTIEATPVIEFAPWHPDSLAGLSAIGLNPAAPFTEPLVGVRAGATYGEVWGAIAAGHAEWWLTIQREFPRNSTASFFALLVSDAGREVLDWFNELVGSIVPVFDPEEIALARMIEFGVFPSDLLYPEMLDEYVQRALELAAAGGRTLPQRSDVIAAIDETFGGHIGGV
jgi:hypothetical protein